MNELPLFPLHQPESNATFIKMHDTWREIEGLYEQRGSGEYFGESVTQVEHALQTAQLARAAGADEETVLASLLHDIGHLLEGEFHAGIGVIDHDRVAEDWLRARGFGERLIRLVRGHVDAKRYLVATNADYFNKLSDASRQTLALQGGPMSSLEVEAFAAEPLLREMLQVRSWDESAKIPGQPAGAVADYRDTFISYCSNRQLSL